MSTIQIEEVKTIEDYVNDLTQLLKLVVDDGASIGFLPPLAQTESSKYWSSVLTPDVHLFVAKMGDQIVGSVQVHLCTKENGLHRAEIAKLMTHPRYRRMGIGRQLMEKAEERVTERGRSLLILDTREGDPSNHLYQSLGFIHAGRIPYYAISADGGYDATMLYYKKIAH
jgi:ribosomal protein S18 acetylase RimI-like enzyme